METEADLFEELIEVLETLGKAEIGYALCGGMAVGFYGYTRFTKDIDLLIAAEDIERAKRALAGIGFDLPAGPIPFDPGTPRARLLHRVSKADGRNLITLDLIVVTPVFADVFDGRELIEWMGREVQVVSKAGLVIMKRLAGRGQDLLDLEKLGLIDENEEETQ